MRSTLISLFMALLVQAVVLPVQAQETADISLGGGLVARLRDRGAFATVAERAANVDQKLAEVVSTKDTQHPQVSVKQRGNLWTVYAWDIPVVSVYPAEAKINQMTEKQLADIWARNLTQQLPKATPCSQLPPEQLGYKPAAAATSPAPVATTPPSTVAAKPATAAPPAAGSATTKPVTTTTTKPTTATKPATTTQPATTATTTTALKPPSTMVGNEAGALLLIVDALRGARELNDQDWATRKETLARELYANLTYYITGKGTPPKPASTTTTTKPATTAAKPVTTTAKPASTSTTTTAAKPATTTTKPPTTPATKPPATTTTTTTTAPAATATPPATDPSMAKVPQKNRIRAKFAAAKPAYDKLLQTDPEAAKQVSDILAASRQHFAYGEFDESEAKVDEALKLLGVTFKE